MWREVIWFLFLVCFVCRRTFLFYTSLLSESLFVNCGTCGGGCWGSFFGGGVKGECSLFVGSVVSFVGLF